MALRFPVGYSFFVYPLFVTDPDEQHGQGNRGTGK